MPTRSPVVRRWLLVGAIAALCGLIYLQVAAHLPERFQVSDAGRLRQANPSCALAEVPRDQLFLSASVFQGGEHTGLIFGQVQTPVKTVNVAVEPGDKPLTLFVTGNAVLFSFSGDVARVRRVVAMSPFMNKGVGVTGIPAQRVEIPPHRECRYFADAMSLEKATVRAKALAVLFGRRPDRDAFQHSAISLSVPENSFALRTEAAPQASPRTIAPGDVVAAVPVTRPQTMPGRAGLAQLEAEGAIRRPTPEEVQQFLAGASRPYQSKLSPDYLLQTKFDYAITRAVTLPQGLYSEVRYLVLAGVPAPRNAHACIAEMDGFRFNSVTHCLPAAHEGIEGLKRMPSQQERGACRLFTLPEAPLHAVAVYEPEQPPLRDYYAVRNAVMNGSDDKPYPIDVRVELPGEIVLLLNTYRPAIWRVSVAPGSRVAAVVSMSYHASRVEGLVPGTPVMMSDNESRRSAAPACRGMWAGGGSGAYRGGPEAMVFDRQVQALTGRSLESLRGAYKLKSVVVR
jgi:hypothetical protein